MSQNDPHYPKWKYHPERPAIMIKSSSQESSLDAGWYDSPAEYGVETCPGHFPDREIAKRKKTKAGGK